MCICWRDGCRCILPLCGWLVGWLMLFLAAVEMNFRSKGAVTVKKHAEQNGRQLCVRAGGLPVVCVRTARRLPASQPKETPTFARRRTNAERNTRRVEEEDNTSLHDVTKCFSMDRIYQGSINKPKPAHAASVLRGISLKRV